MSKSVEDWERAVIMLLNADGWELTHRGDGYDYDAEGKSPKGVEVVMSMNFRKAYYLQKMLEKDRYDKLLATGKVALYFVNDPKGNYLFWLNELKELQQKDFYCPDSSLWTKKKVLKPCYLIDEKDASIININEVEK